MRRKSTEKQTRHTYIFLLHPVWITATKTCIIGQNSWTKNNVNVANSHSFFERFINTHTHTHTSQSSTTAPITEAKRESQLIQTCHMENGKQGAFLTKGGWKVEETLMLFLLHQRI
jgi:hypothetical protein